MLTRKANLLLSLTAAIPLLFAACTDNSLVGPGDVAGTYQLTVFGNFSIPYQFTAQAGDDPELPNGGTVLVTDGTLVLNANGTFIETNNFTKTPPGGSSFASAFVSNGTFTVNGATFTLFAPPQNGYSARNANGTLQFDTVNYTEGGFTYEYRR
ncbi:MAG: hypothetical protein M3P26_02470 [Gemmatimonadota bacterium]|nr:hypothetical protein [Gemmatimonadota bacterium]